MDGENLILMQEIWKQVVGYEGVYSVSSHGRLRRDSVGNIIRPCISSGYQKVVLLKNGIRNGKRLHRLVAEAFLGLCPVGMECNHKNGVKHDNRLENLEWVTPRENMQHASRNGFLTNRKRRSGSIALKQERADWARRIYSHGLNTIRDLSEGFGVSPQTMRWALNYERQFSAIR